MSEVKVFSTPTCPYCVRAKSYLKEKNVVYTSVDVSTDQAGLQEMIKVSGQMGVPVIIIDNEIIVGFDRSKIDAKLGVMTSVDLVIIGAGPAGITAAVYAARKKINFMMISQDIGGQTALSADVENYTGYQLITGQELVAQFEEHLKQFNVLLKNDTSVSRVQKNKDGTFLVETKKESFGARAVIIASGRRPLFLNVKGDGEFRNKGVSYCATCDGPIFSGKDVAVIGGGNSALDATLQMMRIAAKVYLVNINPALGGDPVMKEKIEASDRVEVLNSAVTKEILGEKFVTGLVVEQGGVARTISVGGVFVEIGSSPNSTFIDFVKKNDFGEIMIDNINRTSEPGIFAAGDVTDVPEKQIIVAAGEGAKAVLGVFRYLSERA